MQVESEARPVGAGPGLRSSVWSIAFVRYC